MNYTSIEQSKKLLELGLSPESADIFIPCYGKDNYTEFRPYFREHVTKPDKGDLPCWSVGALIELMPDNIEGKELLITKTPYQQTIMWEVGYGYNEIGNRISKSLIAALFNEVCWLLENNYIK